MKDKHEQKVYYGVVGNGETAVLIGANLDLEWLCAPRFDSFPLFARALDPMKGGALSLSFAEPLTLVSQNYVGRTNVLETVVKTKQLLIRVRDFMPWGKRALIRQIKIENISEQPIQVSWGLDIQPIQTSAYTFALEQANNCYLLNSAQGTVAVGLSGEGVEDGEVVRVGVEPNQSLEYELVVAYGDSRVEAIENMVVGFQEKLEDELNFWESWLAPAKPIYLAEPYIEAYYRSLLVLKLLTYEQTGAVLAAPTASFPAVPNGGDNWDYRYCWLRDGYYTAMALDEAGIYEEASRFYEFAYSVQDVDGSWQQPLYTIDGGNPSEHIIADLVGPHGEAPIRFGNLAADQLQLDNAGNIVHGTWYHYLKTRDRAFLVRYWDNVQKAAAWTMANWRRQENGIWEIRERVDHWVHGKTMCQVCLRAAALIGQELGRFDLAEEWSAEAERIHQEVLSKGWSEERQAYLQHYESDASLDISVLALEFYGLLEPNDLRMQKTVLAFEQSFKQSVLEDGREYSTASPIGHLSASVKGGLNMWGGIARYDYAAVPFYLPTIWLARHYLNIGQEQRAKQLLDICIDCSTSLYLMAEHFDPRTGEQWGNFPQGFSHEELVRILLTWEAARAGKIQPTFWN